MKSRQQNPTAEDMHDQTHSSGGHAPQAARSAEAALGSARKKAATTITGQGQSTGKKSGRVADSLKSQIESEIAASGSPPRRTGGHSSTSSSRRPTDKGSEGEQ